MAKSIKKADQRYYDILVASVEGVAERWRNQYQDVNRVLATGENASEIQRKLDALKPDADPALAAKIIGNQGWTHPMCDCCEKHVGIVAEIGRFEHRKSVCMDCIEFLIKELRQYKDKAQSEKVGK